MPLLGPSPGWKHLENAFTFKTLFKTHEIKAQVIRRDKVVELQTSRRFVYSSTAEPDYGLIYWERGKSCLASPILPVTSIISPQVQTQNIGHIYIYLTTYLPTFLRAILYWTYSNNVDCKKKWIVSIKWWKETDQQYCSWDNENWREVSGMVKCRYI